MGFLKNARDAVRVPPQAASAIQREPGERLLAWGRDDETGATVVAGTYRLYAVGADGDLLLSRPWHLVDAGLWDNESQTLSVTWVDRGEPATFVFSDRTLVPETVRERVQASVVLAERLSLGDGGRRTARVVIRQDLSSRQLLDQTILGPGVRADEPGVSDQTGAVRARLREQAGLD